jgi:hypothetical protein
MNARDLADRLLDAQVEFVLTELAPGRLTEVLADAVDDLLDFAGRMTLEDVVDAERLKIVVRRVADRSIGSPLVADLVEQLADAVYALDTADEHDLGSVVPRERVAALVDKVLAMRTLHDRALDRLAESPAVSLVASKFVSKIISDFVAQNRAMAQKVPGMSSLLSLGTSAASVVRNPLDQLLGDAAGRSAQYAMRRTNSAARDLLDDAPLRDAAMEVWDLHAQEPVGELRKYLAQEDLRDLAVLVYALVLDARDSAFFGEVLDACVDVLFARYGQWDLASLLAEAGVDRDDLVEDLVGFAPPVIEAARADGQLATLVRARLEAFYHAPAVLALLDGNSAT